MTSVESRMVEVDYRKNPKRLLLFIIGNGAVLLGFAGLWVWEYRVPDIANTIDDIVVPWFWLAGFFTVTFFSIRGTASMRFCIAISGLTAFLFSIVLWILNSALAPFFDPMW